MSKPSSEMIERVVREVLAELKQRLGGATGAATAIPAAVAGRLPEPAPIAKAQAPSCDSAASSDCLALAVRVVTMNDVSGRLDGVRRVVVGRGTIITPAVTDELARRGIVLEQADSSKKCAAARVRLAMIVARSDFDPSPLAAALVREGFVVEPSASDCLIAATDQLVKELKTPDTLAVLLSRHTAAGVCLANRQPGVRAISGVDAPSVAAAAAAVGANLLAVDPRAVNFFQLKQMIAEFGRGGVRPCPEVFKKKLA
ncbi:MAG: hypothetical protein LLG00_10265 [Planctomycetaceae bacterium]|nr:hypothetical protein [Planctomycetaceae bacterium]